MSDDDGREDDNRVIAVSPVGDADSSGVEMTGAITPSGQLTVKKISGDSEKDAQKDMVDFSVVADDKLIVGAFKETAKVTYDIEGNFYRFNLPSDIGLKAKAILVSIGETSQVSQALKILEIIENVIDEFQDQSFPEIHVAQTVEGPLAFVWKLNMFTIGFDITDDVEFSSWFVLDGGKDKATRAHGYIEDFEVEVISGYLRAAMRKYIRGREIDE